MEYEEDPNSFSVHVVLLRIINPSTLKKENGASPMDQFIVNFLLLYFISQYFVRVF